MSKIIITINRESGSGGREVAYRMGEMLGLKVYDKAILECLSEKYNLNYDEIERLKTKKTNLWDDFCQSLSLNATSASKMWHSVTV